MRKKPTKPTIQERAEAYALAEQELLKKHKLAKKNIIVFPHHEKPPRIGLMAGWVLKKLGGRIDQLFIDKK